ncbi:VanZ family protein [Aureimonas altamirensis]|uniref:VanZ family protein n=1 Tax=Aureimonas altamirensis TaxID=370622 RepID=UPI001E5597B6|nr:VanZ family protein [Aureimonas altamirensis]UHD47627.1 VanZ family protein [Aureimonas altamirensis]
MKLKILIKAAAWGALAFIAFVTLSPISMRPVSSAPVNIERLGAYLVLGALFGAAYPKRIPLVLGLLVAGSVGLEVSQNLVPGRHGRVDDALFKAAGACLGALAGGAVARIRALRLT